jgi:hypothetical protein
MHSAGSRAASAERAMFAVKTVLRSSVIASATAAFSTLGLCAAASAVTKTVAGAWSALSAAAIASFAAARSAATGATAESIATRTTAAGSDDDAVLQKGACLAHVRRAPSTVAVVVTGSATIARRSSVASTIKATAAVAGLAAARCAHCTFAPNEYRQRLSWRHGDRRLHHTA